MTQKVRVDLNKIFDIAAKYMNANATPRFVELDAEVVSEAAGHDKACCFSQPCGCSCHAAPDVPSKRCACDYIARGMSFCRCGGVDRAPDKPKGCRCGNTRPDYEYHSKEICGNFCGITPDKPKCTCGEPWTKNVIHSFVSPCWHPDRPKVPEAISLQKIKWLMHLSYGVDPLDAVDGLPRETLIKVLTYILTTAQAHKDHE